MEKSKKYLNLLICLSSSLLFQSCFFDGYDDSAYGIFFFILPIIFFFSLIIMAISFIFVKEKNWRIFSAIICFLPFLVAYVLAEVHYFPDYIEEKKYEAARAARIKKEQAKMIDTFASDAIANLSDDEIILFPYQGRGKKKDFVLLKRNDDDSWKESYRFELAGDLIKKDWKLQNSPFPLTNGKYLLAYFDDGSLKADKKYYLAIFVKKEKWELADVIENPYSTNIADENRENWTYSGVLNREELEALLKEMESPDQNEVDAEDEKEVNAPWYSPARKYSKYTFFNGEGIKYLFKDKYYQISYTTFIVNNESEKMQQIVLNPENNSYFTTDVTRKN